MTTQSEPTPVEPLEARPLEGVVIDGRFRVSARLPGAGGAIELYTGTQLSLERKVLIKLLRVEREESAELEQRFRREAMLLSKLDHPSIVHVVDFGVFEGCPYIVREYVEGRSLGQLLAGGKTFSVEDSVPILVQLCEALEHAHQAGVIHRDLSPSKIILSTDGRARITDFGVARLLGRDGAPAENMTSIGTTIAAPEYASPEVLLGQDVDRRADLYSLGAIAYRMLARRAPFAGKNAAELLTARARERLVPLAEAAGLSGSAARFCSVIDRLLAGDREQRCSSASWVAHAFRVSVKEGAVPAGQAGATLIASDAESGPMPALIPELNTDTLIDPPRPEISEAIRASLRDEPEDLPDGTADSVLVADPNRTLTGIKERPHAQLSMRAQRSAPPTEQIVREERPSLWAKSALSRIWDAIGDNEPTIGAEEAEAKARAAADDATAVPPDSLADDGIDPNAAKPDWQIYYERVRGRVVPAAERISARFEIPRRAAELGGKARDLRVRMGLPRLTRIQQLAVAIASLLILVAIVQAASGPDRPPPAPEPTIAQTAEQGRALIAAGETSAAIDHLETSLVQGEKYGEPVLHAVLAGAYLRAGQGTRAVQHYGIAVHKNPAVLDDTDVAALAGLLGLPKGDGEKVGELLREVGPRAIEPVRAVADDKNADRAVRKRAKDLLRALSQPASRDRLNG